MGEIIDFNKLKIKRSASKKGVIFEIYVSVTKYVTNNIDSSRGDIVNDVLTTDTDLATIFDNCTFRFIDTFREILSYWGLSHTTIDELPKGREFQRFRTIGDLCGFIKQRLTDQII